MSFLCLIEIELRFPQGGSLKGKRKEIVSLKEQLRRRFGAAVAETEHHELWQRATLTAALVAREARGVEDTAAGGGRPGGGRVGHAGGCHGGGREAEGVGG